MNKKYSDCEEGEYPCTDLHVISLPAERLCSNHSWEEDIDTTGMTVKADCSEQYYSPCSNCVIKPVTGRDQTEELFFKPIYFIESTTEEHYFVNETTRSPPDNSNTTFEITEMTTTGSDMETTNEATTNVLLTTTSPQLFDYIVEFRVNIFEEDEDSWIIERKYVAIFTEDNNLTHFPNNWDGLEHNPLWPTSSTDLTNKFEHTAVIMSNEPLDESNLASIQAELTQIACTSQPGQLHDQFGWLLTYNLQACENLLY